MESKRGLSAIVATLLIILLTLVAVGIIWVVIRNVVQSGSEQVEITTKCVDVNLNAVAVNETLAGNYSITLHRNPGGEVVGGIKVSILNASLLSSGPMNFGVLSQGDTRTVSLSTLVNGTRIVTNGNTIEYTPFFLDASGNEVLCSQTQTYKFK